MHSRPALEAPLAMVLGRAEVWRSVEMQHAFLVELADTPGALADVTEAIAAKGVNITSVSGTTCGDRARIAIATDDEAQARAALTDARAKFDEKEITTVPLRHEPGSLAKAARQLASARVNIESVLLLGMQGDAIEVGFVTSDAAMARDVLARTGAATG
ncbi:MAG TPA: ACT domain-containing protein [Candidatus Limnocylindrales bacterium]|nr:ACT domain-containing protein [Candidatus Limnocylindrales bacterium]